MICNPIELAKLSGEKFNAISTALYPAATSTAGIENRFSLADAQIDAPEQYLAQQYARFAMHCTGARREVMMAKANYHLAGAFQSGGNEAFWGEVV